MSLKIDINNWLTMKTKYLLGNMHERQTMINNKKWVEKRTRCTRREKEEKATADKEGEKIQRKKNFGDTKQPAETNLM